MERRVNCFSAMLSLEPVTPADADADADADDRGS